MGLFSFWGLHGIPARHGIISLFGMAWHFRFLPLLLATDSMKSAISGNDCARLSRLRKFRKWRRGID
jgi:hypothetical protein